MCLLVESIKVWNHKPVNLDLHQQRAAKSRKELFGADDGFDLEKLISIPENLGKGLFKCRVLFGVKVEKIDFEPYFPRKVETLRVVVDDKIEYSHKFANRAELVDLFEKRNGCDDVLIVKNGLVTDTSFSNILFLSAGRWFTPEKPLLAGTRREFLIESGLVLPADISISDLKNFEKFMLVNAMLDFEEKRAVQIENIWLPVS